MSTNDVRVEIYRSFVEQGAAPDVTAIARKLTMDRAEVERALQELHDDDVIVLRPGTHDVWLAHPFCDGSSPFETRAGGRTWNAICIWDALGILEVIGSDGEVHTTCPDCNEPLTVRVDDGHLVAPADYVVHYGVPAARWYEDVAYT